jgi:hypothetical protein
MRLSGLKEDKKIYIDRGFYDKDNFMWLNEAKNNIKYVTRGKLELIFSTKLLKFG